MKRCFAVAPGVKSLLASVFLLAAVVAMADSGLVDNSKSPQAKVRSVGLHDVQWTRGFWAERFELCRAQVLPGMARLMEATNHSQFFRNFEIAAGLAEGRHRGAPFNDGEFYKFLEAASALLAATHDANLDRELDRYIAVIARAQRSDGYLHTSMLIAQRNGDTNAAPFRSRNDFEMYNLGHLFTAACTHCRATGKTNLLAVARHAADFLSRAFLDAPPEAARNAICPSHYMGIIELYRETREPLYLDLAKRFFALRSQTIDGTDDNQDRIPFEQQTNAMGHAVRANYLYAGAADLFMEAGEQKLWQPLTAIWTNVVQRKLYLTGGCGALYDGASPDAAKDQKSITRVHQAYGRNYQLPNSTAHSETCANIGNVLWNWRMFLATGEARYVDVIELALYNSVLSGVSQDGTNFFYTNPLRITAPLEAELRWPRVRVPFLSSFCCPPNIARTLAEVSGYACAKSDDALWVNLYGGSVVTTTFATGQKVKLTQETDYPWSGRVRFTVNECGSQPFALKLRIPAWASGASLRINNSPIHAAPVSGEYFESRRTWLPKDIVDLDLVMPVQWVEANPLVEETFNQVAAKRGPLVYCLESPDLPAGMKVTDICVPADIAVLARFDRRLFGGIAVLDGTFAARRSADWQGQLYREAKRAPVEPVKVSLIPYFSWANRGKSEMTVWLPRH
jgi:DUF1680 family protein